MDNRNREELKKNLTTSEVKTDFEKEAQDGWEEIGIENWDNIHQKMDAKIDRIIAQQPSKTNPGKKRSFFSFPYGIAAVIMIALGLSIKFIYQDEPENVQLFEAYYRPLSGPEDTFRNEEKLNESEGKARFASEAYDELEYKKAIAFYSELLKESPNNSKYTLFLGLSYINDGKYDDAIVLYNGHSPQGISYDDDIAWYLALAHLRKGEIQTSKHLLKNISSNTQNDYSDTAKELVAKLDKLK